MRIKIPAADDDDDDSGIYVHEESIAGQDGDISPTSAGARPSCPTGRSPGDRPEQSPSHRPYRNGYKITFPVGSLKNNNLLGYDLGLRFNTGKYHDVIKRLAGSGYLAMLDFAHRRSARTAEIRIRIGQKYAGEVLLYQVYNPETARLRLSRP